MNRADRMLAVLSSESRPFTRAEIFEQAGFMLTNNAASELRARGLEVERTQTAGAGGETIYSYELVGSPGEHTDVERLGPSGPVCSPGDLGVGYAAASGSAVLGPVNPSAEPPDNFGGGHGGRGEPGTALASSAHETPAAEQLSLEVAA